MAGAWTVPEHRPTVTPVGKNRVLVTTMIGTGCIAYYVEADDRLLSPWFIATGQHETELTQYFLRHLNRDSHCLDVGAGFGYYSCLMARHCPDGRVLGIEPDRKMADLARDNLFMNDLNGAADIVCAAASDSCDGLTLRRKGPQSEPYMVRSLRIDDLADGLDGRVDFVRIDVDGAEPLVLAGARKVIERNRDIAIVMPWSPGQIAAAGFGIDHFAGQIAVLGLRCFALDRQGERPIDDGMLAMIPYQAGIILRRADAV